MKRLAILLTGVVLFGCQTGTNRVLTRANPNDPPALDTGQPMTDAESNGLRSQAQSYLSSIGASMTVDGTSLNQTTWATVMMAEAQHDAMAQVQATHSVARPVIPAPGTSNYAQKAAAQLCLRALEAAEAPAAGVTVNSTQVAKIVANQQNLSATVPSDQVGPGPSAFDPAYTKGIKRLLLEFNMRKHILATTTGSTDVERLAVWMAAALAHHTVTVTGIPAFSYSTLETLLS